MAKTKKGKRQDNRGYGQRSIPATTASTVTTSQATHEGMKSLLNQMKQDAGTPSSLTSTTTTPTIGITTATATAATSTAPSDRFPSRLQTVVDRLTELGFKDQQVEDVVQALQYSITLESALDWLCLHLSTLELPTLFTDGRLRDSISTVTTTSESLTVVKFHKPSESTCSGVTTSHPHSNHMVQVQSHTDREQQKEYTKDSQEQQVSQQHKAWLLQQYQFVADNVDNFNFSNKNTEQSTAWKKHHNQLPKHQKALLLQQYQYVDDEAISQHDEYESEVTTSSPDDTPEISPEEAYLIEQEKLLKDLEEDVYNEANNYMRTKYEIKQLQSEVKKKRQEVQSLRKRMDKEKAKRQNQLLLQENVVQEESNTKKEVDEEEDGGFLDIFGGGRDNDNDDEEEEEEEDIEQPQMASAISANTTPSPVVPASPSPPKTLIDAVISPNWTGGTPQKILEQQCRKQNLPRPKFTKLPTQLGYVLTITLSKAKKATPEKMTAYHSDFKSGSSLPDYLATKALYQWQPTLPLYHMFPPAFRDMWLSWVRDVDDAKTQETRSLELEKQERLNHLLALIASQPTQDRGQKYSADSSKDADSIATPEQWEDDECDLNRQTAEGPSTLGQRLREEFEQRRISSKYQKMLEIRDTLPMTSFREQVLETVNKHPVTIISAQTGAGKTTQCPQYLLEQALLEGRGDSTQIVVTQPRRVAATSVAERVSEEMCEPRLGRWVGYQIRMESQRSAETKLLFCTTGIVLRRLQEDHNLAGVTHIVVDEVHERQQQTDVLLIALRELLRTTRPDLKVILMSATLDSNLFCNFFGGAPLLNVPGRTFPVSNFHLEDLVEATGHMIEEGSRYALRAKQILDRKATLWVTNRGGDKRREVVDLVSQTNPQNVSDNLPGYSMSTRRSMDRVNEQIINFDLLEDVLDLLLCRPDQNSTLVAPEGADLNRGSVLVFLPGLGEIRSMTERLEGNRHFRDSTRFQIIQLHSTLSPQDQRRAFLPVKPGCRKIILSTNIAETSVTIPDVVCVIDTGRVREVRRNKRTSTSILVTDWCSKASSKQRAGRAGRVQPGVCLKMYSSHTASHVMQQTSEPELRRVPLEEVCLSILASGLGNSVVEFLSKAPQPPEEDSVKAALNVLEEVGAITIIEPVNPSSKRIERLTPLGQHLAKLPVDVRLGKMLIFGALFQCLDKALTIAASLTSQSLFSTFIKDANVAKAKHQSFMDPDSDFATFCNVWKSYMKAATTSTSTARKFCQDNYLNYNALREISDARRQFLDLLCSIGFVNRKEMEGKNYVNSENFQKSVYNKNGNNMELLHAVICAGLYPYIAQLKAGTGSDCTLYHKKERLYFHNSSVNSRKKVYKDDWVVFHEKFGTPSRVSIATTCFVHPMALILFASSVVVKHTDRIIIVDGWIEIKMAAQIGVIMKELRHNVDAVLVKMFETGSSTNQAESMGAIMVEGIVNLLSA